MQREMLQPTAYDTVGNMTSRTNGEGKATEYAYELANQSLFGYDEDGRQISMNDFAGDTAYEYDAVNRISA